MNFFFLFFLSQNSHHESQVAGGRVRHRQVVQLRLLVLVAHGRVRCSLQLAAQGLRRPGHRDARARLRGLQRVHIRLRSDRLGQELHHDGPHGARPEGHHTTNVRRLVRSHRRVGHWWRQWHRCRRRVVSVAVDVARPVHRRGLLHGDLLRARARSPQPEEQEQQPEGARASHHGTVRRGLVQARRQELHGHRSTHRRGQQGEHQHT